MQSSSKQYAVHNSVWLGVPVLAAAVCFYLSCARSQPVTGWPAGLVAAWYGIWLVCVVHWHFRLQAHFGQGYSSKAPAGVLFNMVAGAAAPWLAMYLVGVFAHGLLAVDDLVLEMFPNSVPIVHSAIFLVNEYGVFLAAALAFTGMFGVDRFVAEATRSLQDRTGA